VLSNEDQNCKQIGLQGTLGEERGKNSVSGATVTRKALRETLSWDDLPKKNLGAYQKRSRLRAKLKRVEWGSVLFRKSGASFSPKKELSGGREGNFDRVTGKKQTKEWS